MARFITSLMVGSAITLVGLAALGAHAAAEDGTGDEAVEVTPGVSDTAESPVPDPAPTYSAAIMARVDCLEERESRHRNIANLSGSGAVGVLQFMPQDLLCARRGARPLRLVTLDPLAGAHCGCARPGSRPTRAMDGVRVLKPIIHHPNGVIVNGKLFRRDEYYQPGYVSTARMARAGRARLRAGGVGQLDLRRHRLGRVDGRCEAPDERTPEERRLRG